MSPIDSRAGFGSASTRSFCGMETTGENAPTTEEPSLPTSESPSSEEITQPLAASEPAAELLASPPSDINQSLDKENSDIAALDANPVPIAGDQVTERPESELAADSTPSAEISEPPPQLTSQDESTPPVPIGSSEAPALTKRKSSAAALQESEEKSEVVLEEPVVATVIPAIPVNAVVPPVVSTAAPIRPTTAQSKNSEKLNFTVPENVEVAQAKAFLMQMTATTGSQSKSPQNLYDHLTSVLMRVLDSRPKNAVGGR